MTEQSEDARRERFNQPPEGVTVGGVPLLDKAAAYAEATSDAELPEDDAEA